MTANMTIMEHKLHPAIITDVSRCRKLIKVVKLETKLFFKRMKGQLGL